MKRLSTSAVAKLVGVHPLTLERWLSSGALRWPKTLIADGHVLRLWDEADVERVRRYKEARSQRVSGGKPRPIAVGNGTFRRIHKELGKRPGP